MANPGQIPWPPPGSSRDRHRAGLLAVSGQFLVALDTRGGSGARSSALVEEPLSRGGRGASGSPVGEEGVLRSSGGSLRQGGSRRLGAEGERTARARLGRGVAAEPFPIEGDENGAGRSVVSDREPGAGSSSRASTSRGALSRSARSRLSTGAMRRSAGTARMSGQETGRTKAGASAVEEQTPSRLRQGGSADGETTSQGTPRSLTGARSGSGTRSGGRMTRLLRSRAGANAEGATSSRTGLRGGMEIEENASTRGRGGSQGGPEQSSAQPSASRGGSSQRMTGQQRRRGQESRADSRTTWLVEDRDVFAPEEVSGRSLSEH